MEAACRHRGVVATPAGGTPDLVEDGENGLLVPEENAAALAGALVRVLGDRALAERLGEAARSHVEAWLTTPEQYARRIRDLVEDVVTARAVGRRSYVPRRATRPTTS
jgi:glycosyltransferase involved in cell wall biosynthesis